MNAKLKKLLYKLSVNSRTTTKELGKYIRASQQSASYLLSSLEKKNIIAKYKAVFDPAKFGLINVIVYYNIVDYDVRNDVMQYLKKTEYIVSIEKCLQGADLYVEYCVPNLSLFNKENRGLLHHFKRRVLQLYVFPVIVKHVFNPAYLINRVDDSYYIISGDRDIVQLNKLQKKVLIELQKDARIPMLSIANKLKVDAKTIVSIRKQLEKMHIIKQYSVVLEHANVPIYRSHVLVDLDYRDIAELDLLLHYLRQQKNVVQATKIIGDFELLLVIEHEQPDAQIMQTIRKDFKVSRYIMIESEKVIFQKSVPDILLE